MQGEELDEYATAEFIRVILTDKRAFFISLATALGQDPPVIETQRRG